MGKINKTCKIKILDIDHNIFDFFKNYDFLDILCLSGNDRKIVQFRLIADENDQKVLQMSIPKVEINAPYREDMLAILNQNEIKWFEEKLHWQGSSLTFYQANFDHRHQDASKVTREIFKHVFKHGETEQLIVEFGIVGDLLNQQTLSYKLGHFLGTLTGKLSRTIARITGRT